MSPRLPLPFRTPSIFAATCCLAGSASSLTLVTDFNDFNLDGTYGSWPSTATITSGPDRYTVANIGAFGGGFYDISPNLDGTGETTLELEVSINAADAVAGIGVIVELVDEDLTHFIFRQFGVLPGANQVLSFDLSTPNAVFGELISSDNVLNLADLSFFHVQVDPGLTGTPYEIAYENLQLTGAAGGLAGDYNNNGQVEQGDLDLVLLNWGADGTTPPGGWINDLPSGLIDQAELDGVLLNWGNAAEPGVAAVPEPVSLAALAGLGLMRVCRPRRTM